jgi:RNA polymerase sigma-70 factor (ECF subfamily)
MAQDDDVVELARWRASRDGGVSSQEESPLRRLARGEPGAVEACVDGYGPMVHALVRRLLPQGADVEDVVHEVFVELWRSAQRFDPGQASDRGFVAMIARRRVIDRRRRKDRRVETVALTPERDAPLPSDEHERTLGRLAAAPAVDALKTLAPDRQRWIVMAVVEGFSHRDIARLTDTPLGTVKSGIRRGLAEMRSWMEKQDRREVGP